MLEFSFIVGDGDIDKRLDKAIIDYLNNSSPVIMNKQYSRSKIQEAIDNGHITIDGTIKRERDIKLKVGQKIGMKLCDATHTSTLKPTEMSLKIAYEDEYLAIIDKPAGLVVHPGVGHIHDTLVNGLLAHYGNDLSSKINTKNAMRLGIVHRLDKDTSGLILVAKNDFTASLLNKMITMREIKRTYNAIVYGLPVPAYAKIITNIAKSRSDPTKMMIYSKRGKIAITTYKVIKAFFIEASIDQHIHKIYKKNTHLQALTLVECELDTGRTHQIRVHMRYKGCPIVGDTKYSSDHNFNYSNLQKELAEFIISFPRQALHAKQLQFEHPISKQQLVITSQIPKDMEELMMKLGKINDI